MDENNLNSESEMQNNEPQADEKNTCDTKEILDKKDIYSYNNNPFSPRGRMGRLFYFVTLFAFGIITSIMKNFDPNYENFLLWIITIIIMTILALFLTKKRVYDITFNNKFSWGFYFLMIIISCIPYINILICSFATLCLFFVKGKYDSYGNMYSNKKIIFILWIICIILFAIFWKDIDRIFSSHY